MKTPFTKIGFQSQFAHGCNLIKWVMCVCFSHDFHQYADGLLPVSFWFEEASLKIENIVTILTVSLVLKTLDH